MWWPVLLFSVCDKRPLRPVCRAVLHGDDVPAGKNRGLMMIDGRWHHVLCVLLGRHGIRLLIPHFISSIISNMMQSISSQPKRPGTIVSCTAVLLLFTLVVVPSSAIRTITSFTTSRSSSITPRTTRLSPYACHESKIAQYIPAMNLEVLKVRGGSDDMEDDDDDAELDDVEDVFDEFELGDEADEDDFAENSFLDRAIDAYHKTPPLTKGYLTASAIITGLGWAMNRNQFPEIFLLDWKQTLTKGQIWRPITTFFNFGPLGLGYLLTVHFVWTYMSTLERLHHRKPYEFWIMISFGMMSMVFGYPILKLNARFLGHNLSTFLVYMWSRYHEGMQVKMFEVHTTRAEMLPWYFLLQTFLLEGEPPVLDFLGIVFGHIYYYCNSVGLLRPPESLVQWYKESDSAAAIRQRYKEIASDFEVL